MNHRIIITDDKPRRRIVIDEMGNKTFYVDCRSKEVAIKGTTINEVILEVPFTEVNPELWKSISLMLPLKTIQELRNLYDQKNNEMDR